MRKILFLFALSLIFQFSLNGQPKVPIEEWTGKTILFIGAHPDDDAMSFGTMAMLQDHGNQIYIVILTSGNVGTLDPKISKTDLARIRKKEEIDALAELGIPADHYVNMGYTDGMLELQNKEEIMRLLVRQIRKYKPDVLVAFDPGKGKMRWHKADHRSACWLAADACRAAMWPLLYEGQIIQENLKAHEVREYLLFDGFPEDFNTEVDITQYQDIKINAVLKYVSQFTASGWSKYEGPEMSADEEKQFRERLRKRLIFKNDKVIEQFRYYSGSPEEIGR
ncbi:MAG: PIG-L family deacetylase [Bacteroidales bacterium]|nr:PIG-L family deacetylase [Bacteroidales bacterium]